MRTKNSIKNIFVSMVLGFVAIIISFITQKVFIETLGLEYLGINGLFTSIILMLAVAELGLGSAIVYHLYKPLEDKNEPRVKSLMNFYKKGYRFIALIVLLFGLILVPFLPQLVGDNQIDKNIYLIYSLFLGNAVVSYLLSYKRSILYADQKNYVINIVRIGSIITMNIFQILILIYTQNYYLFLITLVSMTLIENIILNSLVNKRYTYLNNRLGTEPLDKETRTDIFKKVKGLLYHKSGEFLVIGSDNVIISIFLGITTVGLYSNYLLIIMAIRSMFSQLSTAIISSIGNLLLTNDPAKHYGVFKKLFFANFWMSTVIAIGFLVSADSFVSVWFGDQLVLSLGVVLALSINLYLLLVRSIFSSFKTAAGIFYEDRYVPIIEAAVNIVFSIILLQFFGLAGVFMATIMSSLVLHMYSYPKFVYTNLFKRSYGQYFQEFLSYLTLAVGIGIVTFFATRSIVLDDALLQLASNVAVSFAIPNTILYVLYRNSSEFAYFKQLFGKMLGRSRAIN